MAQRHDWGQLDTLLEEYGADLPFGTLAQYAVQHDIPIGSVYSHVYRIRRGLTQPVVFAGVELEPVHPLLHELLTRLPVTERWSQTARDHWVAAFTACLDVEITIEG